MAENVLDDEFKSRMLRFVEVADQKFDGLTSDIRSNSYRLDRFGTKIDALGKEIENLTTAVRDLAGTPGTVSKQFAAVTSKVIEHDQRSNGHESRIGVLEAETH